MDFIDNYFKKYTEKLNFIELKDYDVLNLDESFEDVPLPIMSDVLAEGVATGEFQNGINLKLILDGLISTIGIDEEFKYKDKYIEILNMTSENIGDYIFAKGIKFLEEDKEERANIYFRSIKEIDPKHILGMFNYALALERIANDNYLKELDNLGEAFLKESTLIFETVLDIDEEYPLAYYKLGYHYRNSGKNLKAKLAWEKFLMFTDDDLRKQEVREEILVIEDDVKMETALTYITHNRFEEALEYLLDLVGRNEQRWDVRYLLGFAYANIDEGEKAIAEYEVALSLNDMEEGIYNDLGIEFFKLGMLDKAIEIFTKGLGKIAGSYKLYFNRALAYIELMNLDKAYSDINKALDLNPVDDNVKSVKLTLEKELGI